jgi:tRNA1Val (adenine37-N6)-methyltransferase
MKIRQNNDGYRYSLDPFLLAYFVETTSPPDRFINIIDLGTGSAVIPLCLSQNQKNVRIVGLEIQKKLAELAQKNIRENNLSKQISIIEGDIRNPPSSLNTGAFDLAISNPPYRKVKTGKISPNREKAISRHEIKLTLEGLIITAKNLLKDFGSFKLIYHPSRLQELVFFLDKYSFKIDYLRFVHSKPQTEAKMVLVSSVKNGRNDLCVLPPLFVYNEQNEYTDEVNKIYAAYHHNP